MITLKINVVASQNCYSLKIIYFSNYSVKRKYYDDSSKLVVCNIKDELSDNNIKESVGLWIEGCE